MYKLGKYEIHNWVTDPYKTYRRIGFRYGKRNSDIEYLNIFIDHPYFDGAEDIIRYQIFFQRDIFAREYYQLGFKEIEFDSLEEAKQSIDKFLLKLSKLIVFI